MLMVSGRCTVVYICQTFWFCKQEANKMYLWERLQTHIEFGTIVTAKAY